MKIILTSNLQKLPNVNSKQFWMAILFHKIFMLCNINTYFITNFKPILYILEMIMKLEGVARFKYGEFNLIMMTLIQRYMKFIKFPCIIIE